jgi:cytochrome c biogenesis protein CcdA
MIRLTRCLMPHATVLMIGEAKMSVKVQALRDRRDATLALATPFVAGGVLLAFFGSEIRSFATTSIYVIGGLAISTGVFAFLLGALLFDDKKAIRWVIAGLLLTIAGLSAIVAQICIATQKSDRFDYQCMLLEADMQRLKPLRSDSKDLYDVMHCRYQASGTLTFGRPFQK